MPTLSKGIDVSHYQIPQSWQLVANYGVDMCYIKLTQGTSFVDPMALTHANNARAVGINVGFYHFADTTVDAAVEASFFRSHLANVGDYQLLPTLDLEVNKSSLTPTQIEAWIQAFLDAFVDPMMIYSYQPFLDANLPPSHTLGKLPLWLAQYRAVTHPMLPIGWTKAALWQTTNAGNVPGISTAVDLDTPLTDDFLR
jgi:lysozyme